MNTRLMLKAPKEIVKQYANIENMSEEKYREECIKAIQRGFDTDMITSEIIMYLSEWDWYTRPLDNIDFTLVWYENEWKIKARVYYPWRYYNVIYEFNDNCKLNDLLDSLEQIDKKHF